MWKLITCVCARLDVDDYVLHTSKYVAFNHFGFISITLVWSTSMCVAGHKHTYSGGQQQTEPVQILGYLNNFIVVTMFPTIHHIIPCTDGHNMAVGLKVCEEAKSVG